MFEANNCFTDGEKIVHASAVMTDKRKNFFRDNKTPEKPTIGSTNIAYCQSDKSLCKIWCLLCVARMRVHRKVWERAGQRHSDCKGWKGVIYLGRLSGAGTRVLSGGMNHVSLSSDARVP